MILKFVSISNGVMAFFSSLELYDTDGVRIPFNRITYETNMDSRVDEMDNVLKNYSIIPPYGSGHNLYSLSIITEDIVSKITYAEYPNNTYGRPFSFSINIGGQEIPVQSDCQNGAGRTWSIEFSDKLITPKLLVVKGSSVYSYDGEDPICLIDNLTDEVFKNYGATEISKSDIASIKSRHLQCKIIKKLMPIR